MRKPSEAPAPAATGTEGKRQAGQAHEHYSTTIQNGHKRNPCGCEVPYFEACYCLPDDAEIADALRDLLKAGAFDPKDTYIEGFDTVRIAFAWLDAQRFKNTGRGPQHALKHIIEGWADRYVSRDAVVIAAHIHPRIRGKYPGFNLSGSKYTYPDPARLAPIPSAGKQPKNRNHNTLYARQEVL